MKRLGVILFGLFATAVAKGLPLSVDNSRSKYFPPVFNQIGGSCAQASSVGYMFTYEMNRLLDTDPRVSKSNRFSYLYTWNLVNDGMNIGSFSFDAIKLARENGIMSDADFPVQTSPYPYYWASGYSKYYNACRNRISKVNRFDISTAAGIEKLKGYLYNKGIDGEAGGVVVFSAKAGNWKFDKSYGGPSQTGYKSILTKLSTEGGHAMTIVGYDDLVEFTTPDGELTKGAFIVVNSYGDDWQDRGRYYLPYWFFLDPARVGADLSADVNGIDVQVREPRMMFKVNMKYTSRDDISFRMGCSDVQKTYPVYDYPLEVFSNQGGDHNMQGANAPADIEFGFDFTSYLPNIPDYEKPAYYLTIQRGRYGKVLGEGSVQSVELYDYRSDREHPSVLKAKIDGGSAPIQNGDNVFRLCAFEARKCSRSSLVWVNGGGEPVEGTLVVRTASGKYAKVRITSYDRNSSRIRLKYVYAPDGRRKFL